MANYNVLGNDYARQITESQCEPNSNYNALKRYLEQQGMGFNVDRNIAIVGKDPKNADSSYTMVIAPTFTKFDFGSTPSHAAASIVSYFADGKVNHVAAIADISHEPLQIARLTLLEIGKDGSIVPTTVDRVSLVNQTPEEIGARMNTEHLQTPNAKVIPTNVMTEDLASIATFALDTLLKDSYAGPLYPVGGAEALSRDGVVAANFATAVGARASLFDFGLEITVCTSTSSNSCSSCSSTLTIDL